MASTASAVTAALAARLASITVGAGYATDLKAVYWDSIPMGLEFAAEQLPCAFLLDRGATFQHELALVHVVRAYEVQLVLTEGATDADLYDGFRDLAKAVYANSAAAAVLDQFRFHAAVYLVEIDTDETDLNMVEGNRIATFRLLVHYRCKPYDL